MATPETEGINNEEYDHEDAVLNLSMEDHPYIVPVGIDSLFTVEKFYPCDPDLADALEAAYDQIKPWDLSYEDELRSALKIGTEAEDKLKVHLKEFDHDVIFDTATQGRLYSTAVSSRISKTILRILYSYRRKRAGYSGGTVVIRGGTSSIVELRNESSRLTSNHSQRGFRNHETKTTDNRRAYQTKPGRVDKFPSSLVANSWMGGAKNGNLISQSKHTIANNAQ
ncbi:hypothetical protein KEM48_006841 [Puccinia striiformis f. sp. tritici PST-130]|nr:hypothetical protein KEM48_006841 [Puccinia striiformis f. sp. tritici PST-130]